MNERKLFQDLKQRKRNNLNSFSNLNNSNAYTSRSEFKCSYPEIMG